MCHVLDSRLGFVLLGILRGAGLDTKTARVWFAIREINFVQMPESMHPNVPMEVVSESQKTGRPTSSGSQVTAHHNPH